MRIKKKIKAKYEYVREKKHLITYIKIIFYYYNTNVVYDVSYNIYTFC